MADAENRNEETLAGAFLADGSVTCMSPEEYTTVTQWLASQGLVVDSEVDEETGQVTFVLAKEQTQTRPRPVQELVAAYLNLGSVVMTPDEAELFDAWVRANNVPAHRQVDRKLGKVVAINRGWGTIEGA